MLFLFGGYDWLRVASLDYYLERLSFKLDTLFSLFPKLVLILVLLFVLCSSIMWLVIPFIELRKKNLLQKMSDQLLEIDDLLYSIKELLSRGKGEDEE